MTNPIKHCACCESNYYSLKELNHLGDSDIGSFYNCDCGSTLFIPTHRKVAIEEAEFIRNMEEYDQFLKEHLNWSRI